jgi:hypothetical protein
MTVLAKAPSKFWRNVVAENKSVLMR